MRPPRRGVSAVHVPVLKAAVLEILDLSPGQIVVDATLGGGGHSSEIVERIAPGGTLIGIDRDPMMLDLARARLQNLCESHQISCHLFHCSYVQLPQRLAELQLPHVDRVLADLGLASDQLERPERGFRFDADVPLDLRFDTGSGIPAHERLRTASGAELSAIFRDYGEERHAEAIARAIVEQRHQRPLQSARDVSDLVASLFPRGSRSGAHPATRVFQALRIDANRELEHVETFLTEVLPEILVSGGRAAVISFHSLEDRIVKNAFRDSTRWSGLNKKPIQATPAEKRHNPRSRSAKLRAAVRI